MPDGRLTRRASLLLPLLLVACGSHERTDFPTLRYSYLRPIRLNVASISIEQPFRPTGVAPDISQLDPAQPADALRAMAQDRLKPYGTSGRAVFVIQDASLTRRDDVINGSMRVRLEIYNGDNTLAGFAEASATAQHTGRVSDLRDTLYEMTKSMMDNMNVEFELQVNNSLHDWLASDTAAPAQVQATPLDGSATPPPPTPMPDGMAQPGMAQPGMAQPGMAQPGMAQPGMAQPGTAQPGSPPLGSPPAPEPLAPPMQLAPPAR
jgi:hypothetical protein